MSSPLRLSSEEERERLGGYVSLKTAQTYDLDGLCLLMRLGMMPYLGGMLVSEEKGTLSLCGTLAGFVAAFGLVGYPLLSDVRLQCSEQL